MENREISPISGGESSRDEIYEWLGSGDPGVEKFKKMVDEGGLEAYIEDAKAQLEAHPELRELLKQMVLLKPLVDHLGIEYKLEWTPKETE